MSEIFSAIGECEAADRDLAEARDQLELLQMRLVATPGVDMQLAAATQERLVLMAKLALVGKVARLKWLTGRKVANG